jgi:WhiB family redox-sensing transcriptional regulator
MHPPVLQATDEDLDDALRTLASCNDPTTDWTLVFFSEDLYDIARAKHVCSSCVVQDECLTGAIERREPWGVWGGELFLNGHMVINKRRRGRPPKNRPAETMLIDGVEVVVVPAIQSA